MDSDSYLERRTGHLSRYDLEEPQFQHKRRMNGSPSRHAREPNLPVRKKVPRDEEHNDDNNNENEDDFIILGDQSKFRLDMIPYRARSLSAPRYSDSTDMLTWLGNGDNENNLDRHYRDRRLNRTGDRHVDKSYNTTMVSDSHYHSCEDETANQSLALKQLPRNDDDNQEFDDAALNSKARMQSPKRSQQNPPLNEDHKRVKVLPSEATGTKSKQTTQRATQRKSVATKPNSTRMNTLNSNANNKKRSTAQFAAPRTKWNVNGTSDPRSQINKTDKTSKAEFRTKGDIGKFPNDRLEERTKQNPKNGLPEELRRDDDEKSESSGRGKQSEREKMAAKKSATSNESLGATIASRSQQNKENVNNNVVVNEEVLNQLDHANEDHRHHHQPRSSHHHHPHSSHRSLSEYQDKFRPPLSTSFSLMKSQQPRLTWLTTEAPLKDARSEYADQFRPKSALDDHQRNHYHNSHHHNVMRDGTCSSDGHQNGNYVHPELAANQGFNDAGVHHHSSRDGAENNRAEGYDGQHASGMHEHNDQAGPRHHQDRRHYKSEYAVKFIPPSDFLLVDGIWVKADHIQRILGDHNSVAGRGARWGEVRDGNGFQDRSLRLADFGNNSTPHGGRSRGKNDDVDNNSNNVADETHQRQHLGDSWFDYILELRKKADEYRNRGFGINFSRDHLAQIRSKNLRYWDESSLDSITPDEEEVLQERIGHRQTSLVQPIVNTIHHSTSNKPPGFYSFDRQFGTNPANQSGHQNSALHNNHPAFVNQHDNNNLATYPGQHRYNDDPNTRTNRDEKVGSHRPGRSARGNLIGGDSDDLADSLSSSLSLAEEVLERARTRKDRLWTTK